MSSKKSLSSKRKTAEKQSAPSLNGRIHSTRRDPIDFRDKMYVPTLVVNWCVERFGHAGTDSVWARSWLSWGRTTSPTKGCIVVFERGTNSRHVAFFVSKTATKIKVLGGNQSDEVNISEYPASRLLGFRVQAYYALQQTYNAPHHMEDPNCFPQSHLDLSTITPSIQPKH